MITTRNQLRRKRSVVDSEENQQRKRPKHNKLERQPEERPSETKTRKSKSSPRRKIEATKFTDGMFQASTLQQDKTAWFSGVSLFGTTNTAPAPSAPLKSTPSAFLAHMQVSSEGENTQDLDPDYTSFIENFNKDFNNTHPPLWEPSQILPPSSVNQLPDLVDTPKWNDFMVRERAKNVYLVEKTSQVLKLRYIIELYIELAAFMVMKEHQYWYHTRFPSGDDNEDVGIWTDPSKFQQQANFLDNLHQIIRHRSDKINGAFKELGIDVGKICENYDENLELHRSVRAMGEHESNLNAHYIWVLNQQLILKRENGYSSLITIPEDVSEANLSLEDEPMTDLEEEKTMEQIDAAIVEALAQCPEFDSGLRFAVDSFDKYNTVPAPKDLQQKMQHVLETKRKEGCEEALKWYEERLNGPPAEFIEEGINRAATEFINHRQITCPQAAEIQDTIKQIHTETKNRLIDELIKTNKISGSREKDVVEFLRHHKYNPRWENLKEGEAIQAWEHRVKKQLAEELRAYYESHYKETIDALQRGADLSGGWISITEEQYTPGIPINRLEGSMTRLARIGTEAFLEISGEYLLQFLTTITSSVHLTRLTILIWSTYSCVQFIAVPCTTADDPQWINLGVSITQFLNNSFFRRINFPPNEGTPQAITWLLQHIIFYFDQLRTHTNLYILLFFLSSQYLTLFSYALIRNSCLIGEDAWLSGSTTRQYAFFSCLMFSVGLSSIFLSNQLNWISSLQWAGVLALAIGAFGFAGVWGEAMGRAFQLGTVSLEEVQEMDHTNTFDLRNLIGVTDKNLTTFETDPAELRKQQQKILEEKKKKHEEARVRRQWELYMRFMMGGLVLGFSIGACLALSWLGLFGPDNILIRFIHSCFRLYGLLGGVIFKLLCHGIYLLGEIFHMLGTVYIRIAKILGLPYVGRGGPGGDFSGWVEGWWRGGDIEVLASAGILDYEPETEAVLKVERFLVGRF